jgi:hypothetical protein
MNNTNNNNTNTLEPRSAGISSEPFAEEAEWIRREHEILTYDAAAVVERAAGIGETLERIKAELKAELGHGAWGPWTERNLPELSDRTLRRYMEIFRRKSEPLALEDPAAFLAGIYGNLELPPPEAEADAAVSTISKTDVTSDLPPPKRTSKRRKIKTPPDATSSTSTDAPPPTSTVPGQQAGPVSLETHLDLAAEALERAVADWRRASLAPLREAARGNERISRELKRLEQNLADVVEELRGYARMTEPIRLNQDGLIIRR